MFGTWQDTKYDVKTLEELCEPIKDGTHKTPTYTEDKENGFLFLSSKDVTSRYIDWDHPMYIPADLHEKLSKRISPKKGDILLAKNGTTGIAAIVDRDVTFDIYVSLALLRFHPGNNIKFMWSAINMPETKAQFDGNLKGIGVPNLHLGEIKKTKMVVPPLELQEEFAKFVEQSDKSKFTGFKSQFIEMFGDLSQNTRNYPVKKLSDIADYWNGLTYKPSDAVESDAGTLVLRSSNIQNGELVFEDNVFVNCAIKEKLYVQDNDILMCSRNGSAALVGKTALIKGLKEPTTFGAFMMIIRSKYYPYLKTYFELPFFRNQISTGTSTINQITGKMLNDIQLPVPDMEAVSQFENFVHQSDKSK